MTSLHTCPQYSQVNAADAIARVQPAHRFQVIANAFGQAPYHDKNPAFCRLFQPPRRGVRGSALQN
jgi:hypothetical protein